MFLNLCDAVLQFYFALIPDKPESIGHELAHDSCATVLELNFI